MSQAQPARPSLRQELGPCADERNPNTPHLQSACFHSRGETPQLALKDRDNADSLP
jgi:hypothetical protein